MFLNSYEHVDVFDDGCVLDHRLKPVASFQLNRTLASLIWVQVKGQGHQRTKFADGKKPCKQKHDLSGPDEEPHR